MFFGKLLKKNDTHKFDNKEQAVFTITQICLNENAQGKLRLKFTSENETLSVATLEANKNESASLNVTLIVNSSCSLKVVGDEKASGTISIFGLL